MIKFLVMGTLRHLLGLLVIMTVIGTTIAASFIPAPGMAKPILLVAGFVAGLVIAAICFGTIYLLFDIADNTRATAEMIRSAQEREAGLRRANFLGITEDANERPKRRIEPKF